MKRYYLIFTVMSLFLSAGIHLVYAQETAQIKTVDVNNDGAPDVTYYSDGAYVSKIEADTNYDGTPDVTVNLKDGKFESAEADTDYNGSVDKKFNNASEFSSWVNENHPDFNDKLNKANFQFDLLKF